MKKITIYIACMVVLLSGMTACGGRDWDTDDELEALSINWSEYFVLDVLNYIIEVEDSAYNNDNGRIVTVLKSIDDTLNMVFRWKANTVKGDSMNVCSTLIQIGDTATVVVDGYRYSDNLWAHLYTVDPGIINYKGMFRIDFYETGKTTPWAWSETTFEKDTTTYHYKPYKRNDPKVGRY